ncbi:MAG TPA: SecD/SecF family protein translocase subunit, partial [Candidatus Binatia bacterium]|nr:SecD/SecF family protein translocase subunit [Candidatus Binatia bacterium]
IKLISQQNVGATLGIDSMNKSIQAGIIGFAIVSLFMLIYYRLPGLIAVISLVIYTLISISLFKLFGITLTLAGIAGFILSIGMAVDANVLIFERMKEELRKGKGLSQALEDGFARAWLSVRDSNTSSLITTFILGYFGTSIIRGFAITLSLGIIVSMFTAITLTRTLLRFIVRFNFLSNRRLYGVAVQENQNA